MSFIDQQNAANPAEELGLIVRSSTCNDKPLEIKDCKAAATAANFGQVIGNLRNQIYEMEYAIAYAKSILKSGQIDASATVQDILAVSRNLGITRFGNFEHNVARDLQNEPGQDQAEDIVAKETEAARNQRVNQQLIYNTWSSQIVSRLAHLNGNRPQ